MKFIFGLLALVLFVRCGGNTVNEPARFKTIMIKSSGEVETLPNEATFFVNLTCQDKSISTSKKCLVDKSNELTKQLQAFGIKPEDILTTTVNLNKNYTWRNNSRVFEGYNSSTMMYVTIRDLNKLDQVYTELLENRNLELGGLSYTHSGLDSLKNEAYADALKKSGVLVQKLLDELPEDEKEILKIGNVQISASLPESMDANLRDQNELQEVEAVAVQQNRAISINKGTVIVNATLFVEYLIK